MTQRDPAGGCPEADIGPGGSDAGEVATVLFLDLVRYTSLTEIHGDSVAADAASAMDEVSRDSMRTGTRLVKSVGDGVLVTAESPRLGLVVASSIVEGLHELGTGLDARVLLPTVRTPVRYRRPWRGLDRRREVMMNVRRAH